MPYKSVVQLKEQLHDTFEDACKHIIAEAKKLLESEQATLQVLETTYWIEKKVNYDWAYHMDFYAVRDYCVENNLIDNKGNWIEATVVMGS